MGAKIEAQVALCKCSESKKVYGVRMEKSISGWKYDWAFEISDDRAKAEGFDNTDIVGNIYPDLEYPGCPYCKVKTFVICGACGRLNCNNSDSEIFTCEWCGAQGELTDYSGSGIKSVGDV